MSLLLAQVCAVCDRATNQTFCPDCQRQIRSDRFQALSVEALPSASTLPVGALGIYERTLKQAILALKYGDRPDVAQVLGADLGQRWLKSIHLKSIDLKQKPTAFSVPQPGIKASLYVLPIPLHASRQQARGYNQAELIAQAFCTVTGLPLLAQGLARIQATLPQHQLSLADRQHNLSAAFSVGTSLQQKIRLSQRQKQAMPSVLLIDDIYTTGATVQSAATTLAKSGVAVRGVLVLARAKI